ncbi:MAG: stage III sporulation protein AF [Eubacteriales bacterium]|nr:stage III sporulation protein AF [Eubacteriales bacterium]
MNEVNEWVKNIFMIVLGLSFVEILLPEGDMSKYLKYIFSIMILAVILSPLRYFIA